MIRGWGDAIVIALSLGTAVYVGLLIGAAKYKQPVPEPEPMTMQLRDREGRRCTISVQRESKKILTFECLAFCSPPIKLKGGIILSQSYDCTPIEEMIK